MSCVEGFRRTAWRATGPLFSCISAEVYHEQIVLPAAIPHKSNTDKSHIFPWSIPIESLLEIWIISIHFGISVVRGTE